MGGEGGAGRGARWAVAGGGRGGRWGGPGEPRAPTGAARGRTGPTDQPGPGTGATSPEPRPRGAGTGVLGRMTGETPEAEGKGRGLGGAGICGRPDFGQEERRVPVVSPLREGFR